MKYILLPTVSLLFSLSSFAQESASATDDKNFDAEISSEFDTIKNKKGGVLREVIITANKEKKPVSALRSGLKPMDTPQSVQVIGAEIITQQQAIRLSEVIKNINGVYVGSARG
ncbi:TonB-dependent receptor plug domain-containing protein, partial [Flavobacterium sp. XS1P32]